MFEKRLEAQRLRAQLSTARKESEAFLSNVERAKRYATIERAKRSRSRDALAATRGDDDDADDADEDEAPPKGHRGDRRPRAHDDGSDRSGFKMGHLTTSASIATDPSSETRSRARAVDHGDDEDVEAEIAAARKRVRRAVKQLPSLSRARSDIE